MTETRETTLMERALEAREEDKRYAEKLRTERIANRERLAVSRLTTILQNDWKITVSPADERITVAVKESGAEAYLAIDGITLCYDYHENASYSPNMLCVVTTCSRCGEEKKYGVYLSGLADALENPDHDGECPKDRRARQEREENAPLPVAPPLTCSPAEHALLDALTEWVNWSDAEAE